MKRIKTILNRPALALGLAWTILMLVNLLHFISIHLVDPEKHPWSIVLTTAPITFPLGWIIIYIWLVPGYQFLRGRGTVVQIFGFIIHGAVYSAVYTLSIFFLMVVVSPKFNMHNVFDHLLDFFYNDFPQVTKNYLYLLAMLFAFDYLKSREETVAQKKELENQLLSARLHAVEAHLQPHFLFNALNSIVAVIDEDKEKAQDAMIQLSNLLRKSLQLNPRALIHIKEERALLEKYLEIEQLRYENQLQITWEENYSAEPQLYLPSFLLQPLVENAIKHGFRGHSGALRIQIRLDEEARCIEICNNGAPLRETTETGKGLELVRKRLAYHYPNQYEFQLTQADDWVCVKIRWYDV